MGYGFPCTFYSTCRITQVRIIGVALHVGNFHVCQGDFALQTFVLRLLRKPVEVAERVVYQFLSHRSRNRARRLWRRGSRTERSGPGGALH